MAIMHGGCDVLDDVVVESESYDESDDAGGTQFSPKFDINKRVTKLRKYILDVGPNLTYTISGGRIIPPKQY